MADAEKISNYQIRLDAMDKIYPNDTKKMLSEELQNDNGRKLITFFKFWNTYVRKSVLYVFSLELFVQFWKGRRLS